MRHKNSFPPLMRGQIVIDNYLFRGEFCRLFKHGKKARSIHSSKVDRYIEQLKQNGYTVEFDLLNGWYVATPRGGAS